MSCKSPQLVVPFGGVKSLEVPCGICYGCDVDRRLARRKVFQQYKSRLNGGYRV